MVMEEEGKKVKKLISNEEEKDVTYLTEISQRIDYIMQKRGINPRKGRVCIGYDGGGNSLKVMANISEDDEEEEEEEEQEGEVEGGGGKADEEGRQNAFAPKLLTGVQIISYGIFYGRQGKRDFC